MDHSVKTNNLYYNSVIGLILLLLAEIIGPEILTAPAGNGIGTGKVAKEEKKEVDKYELPTTYNLKKKVHHDAKQIDEELFLKSFKRQAQVELIDCLRENFPETNFLILNAELSKTGKLGKISNPLINQSLPDCVNQSISVMTFDSLTTKMKVDFVALSWRISW